MAINPRELNLARQIIDRVSPIEQKQRAAELFFKELRMSGFRGCIYYPANGTDFPLDASFPPSERYYLDSEPRRADVVKGNLNDTPDLLAGRFQGIFYQDTHATRRGISETLRTLEPGGLVVVSLWECGIEPKDSLTASQIISLPQLQRHDLITNPNFVTLLKK